MAATLITLASFNNAHGGGPYGLVVDSSGNLLGTTTYPETMFELTKTSSGYSTVPTFITSIGTGPSVSNLITDGAGNLLFTTSSEGTDPGSGGLYEIAKTGTGYSSTLQRVTSFPDSRPYSGVVLDSAGNLIGTTTDGGSSDDGTVYEIAKTNAGYSTIPQTIASFDGADGSGPYGALTMDSRGDLFGTSGAGGTTANPNSNNGTVFEIAKTPTGYSSTPTVLASFDGVDGDGPSSSLVMDREGDLFGTTFRGGGNGYGTVFEITKTATGYSNTPTTLAHFHDFTDGKEPDGLIIDGAGDLFGTTFGGNDSVFEIVKTATGYDPSPKVVVAFGSLSLPLGTLFADKEGNLFGTTSHGGTYEQGTVFEVTDSGFVVPCYCRGTLIRTDKGEVPVEALAVDDRVVTLSGELKLVTWIGKGQTLVTAKNRTENAPIIVRRDAIAPSVPNRDLHVTPGHALFLDGILVPVHCLVNGRSIVRDERDHVMEFYHIELERHDVLLANNAPAESYRDDGNRDLFHNATGPVFTRKGTASYAPVHDAGPEVDRVWRILSDRAGPPAGTLTDDPDLHLIIDGARLDPVSHRLGIVKFRLDRVPTDLRIVSRSTIPTLIGTSRDNRSLGIGFRRLVLRRPGLTVTVGYEADNLTEGFNEAEVHNDFRWTTGDASIPLGFYSGLGGAFELDIHLAATATYPVGAEGRTVTVRHAAAAAA